MLIVNSGFGLNIQDKVLESSLQKLGVKIVCQGSGIEVDTDILDAMLVSINRVTRGGGSVPICYPMSMLHLLEIAAVNEGAYRALNMANTEVLGTIDISNFGTLVLGEEYISISVMGITANYRVELYSIEGDSYTESSISYELNSVQKDAPKKLFVGECYAIALPCLHFQKLELQFADGRTASYSDIEMKMLCNDRNDLVSIWGNATNFEVTYGFENLYVLEIANVVNAVVTYIADAKFYTLKEV